MAEATGELDVSPRVTQRVEDALPLIHGVIASAQVECLDLCYKILDLVADRLLGHHVLNQRYLEQLFVVHFASTDVILQTPCDLSDAKQVQLQREIDIT